VQYLAPIIKNRQYNFPPVGTAIGLAAPIPVVGATARPNEITYSEDRMRPDYIPPQATQGAAAAPPPAAEAAGPLPAETGAGQANPGAATTAIPTDPQAGLTGMMVPTGAGP
jgi:phospholipid/cholesterol/gamma-HCH transport system substrate-binding protein